MKHQVTIYSKPECHLCDRAKEVRVESQTAVPFEVDGELAKTTPVVIKAAPFKLKVAM